MGEAQVVQVVGNGAVVVFAVGGPGAGACGPGYGRETVEGAGCMAHLHCGDPFKKERSGAGGAYTGRGGMWCGALTCEHLAGQSRGRLCDSRHPREVRLWQAMRRTRLGSGPLEEAI